MGCAGIIIHNIKDYQDIRKIRIILSNIPITIRVIIVANLSLCGLPFLRGFYSKDIILETIIISRIRLVMFIIMIMATFFTAAYSCRLSFYWQLRLQLKTVFIYQMIMII